MAQAKMDSWSSFDEVKKNPLAVAVLMDIAYFSKRKVSELISDLNIEGEQINIFQGLENGGFIRPNPHRNVMDIKYVLAEKGYFLLNELKLENPDMFQEIEPKLKL